jgi:heptosyltransferase-2
MPDAARVLVMAPNWLGDAVMALPALADVARHFGGARMTVAARSSVAPLYSLVPAVDEVVTLQWRGTPARRRALHTDVERLRGAGAELSVLFPNSFASAWLVKAAGIAERWGYAADWRRPLLTRGVRRPRRSLHQAAYYQALVRELGMANGPLDPQVEIPAGAIDAARALLMSRGWDGVRPLMAVAPGAAYGTAKRWPPPHFVRVIERMAREQQVTAVLVGSEGDAETTRWIVRATDSTVRLSLIDLAGATSLETLAGVLRLARVCVSNDSGAMHLAGAVGVPLAAPFGPTREYETSPLTRPGKRLELLVHPVWCRPCMLRECPIDHRCMKGLTPDRVGDAVVRLMDANPS